MKLLAKDRNVKHKLSYIIFDSLLLLLFFIKCLHFYNITVGNFIVPLAAVSVCILGLIFALIVPFSPKAANITLITLYCIFSIISAADLVYFNYMHDKLSFMQLNNVGQLGEVTGAIETLIGPEQLLPLWDLPVLFLLAVHTQLFRKIRNTVLSWKAAINASISVVIISALLISGYMIFGGFKLQHFSSEIILYHSTDFFEFLFPKKNTTVVDKDQYLSTGAESSYYGVAEGRNVFMIQIEAFQEFVLGEKYKGTEITPFLNSLINNDSLYFENYYYIVGGGNTADAEFAANNSLYPIESTGTYQEYPDNDFHGLPWLLRDHGYTQTTAFHANAGYYWGREEAYPHQGFMDYISIEDVTFHPNEGCVFVTKNNKANTDRRLYEDVMDAVVTYEEPFYSFIITLSSHSPFAVAPADRYVDADNPAPNLMQLYLQSTAYVDRTIEEFFDALKQKGLYENSIFVLYGDHLALSEEYADQIEEFTDEPYTVVDTFKVPLIIHIPGLGTSETIDTVGSHIDITPTLLGLMGIKNDKSVMFGHNLLVPDYEGIVYELKHRKIGTFITKDVFFEYTEGNINSRAYDMDGNEIEVTDEHLRIAEEAIKTINDCHALIDRNEILLN